VPRSIAQEGVHELSVTVVDEYYNEARDAVRFGFEEDEGAPDVLLQLPRTGASFRQGDTLEIRAEATDESGALKYVQFYLGDLLLTTKPSPPFTVRYPLSDTAPGTYTVRAVAEDLAKNRSEDAMEIVVGE
jgi:hypothetical protein